MLAGPDPLRDAAPDYDDLEAERARAGVATALFGVSEAPAQPPAVGRYRIDGRVGAGGMGVVYRAHDPDLDRPVAVKLLHADAASDDTARARMLREARALAKLSHPNVITVYDVGTAGDQVFVAMELVHGDDLRRWLSDGSRSWREILAVFIAAGRGLEAAHRVALVHRDFKPENVLVGADGRVRVLDFGLARLHQHEGQGREGQGRKGQGREGQGHEGDADTHASSRELISGELPSATSSPNLGVNLGANLGVGLTQTGALLGTPLYMAPELYDGAPADAASDQFAFCASLYEGLYGRRPFAARTLRAHIEAVRSGQLREPPTDSPVPLELWLAIARGMALDRGERHDDMGELLAALERIASASASALPGSASQPTTGGGRLRWFIVGLVVLLTVVGLVAAELGLFSRGSGAPAVPDPTAPSAPDPKPDPQSEPNRASPVDARPAQPDAQAPVGVQAPAGDPSELAPSDPALDSASALEPGPDPSLGEPSEADGVLAAPAVAPAPAAGRSHEAAGDGWCHLHEDRYTLLARTSSRRSQLARDGTCYECRVERRRSRTRSFSPRDCAGYSLCGPTASEACE